jgi:hypothetical protein
METHGKYDSKMKKYLMSLPAIITVSIVLPCFLELLMEWLWMVSRPYNVNGAIVHIVTHVIFVGYAGVSGYFCGKKMWHQFAIFFILFIAQSIVYFLFFCIRFGINH